MSSRSRRLRLDPSAARLDDFSRDRSELTVHAPWPAHFAKRRATPGIGSRAEGASFPALILLGTVNESTVPRPRRQIGEVTPKVPAWAVGPDQCSAGQNPRGLKHRTPGATSPCRVRLVPRCARTPPDPPRQPRRISGFATPSTKRRRLRRRFQDSKQDSPCEVCHAGAHDDSLASCRANAAAAPRAGIATRSPSGRRR